MTVYNPEDYGAVADNGATNSSAAFAACYADALADTGEIEIPGNGNGDAYAVNNWVLGYSGASYLNKAVKIHGQGQDRTILQPFTSGQTIINYPQSGGIYTFQQGGCLEGLTLDGNNYEGSQGIQIRALFQWDFAHLNIRNFLTNGIRILNQGAPIGDYDASNQLYFKHLRISDCDSWGILVDAASANNETSFLVLESCFINQCGLPGWVGGGMYWKGQCLTLNNCAFTLNQNSALWVPGGAGLSSNLLVNNTAFENNLKRHITIFGLKNADFNNIQLYSNDTYKTDYGIYLNAADAVIANIRVNSCKLRATASNTPHYAFAAFGSNLNASTCQVVNAQLNRDNYGYPGQTINYGWTFI